MQGQFVTIAKNVIIIDRRLSLRLQLLNYYFCSVHPTRNWILKQETKHSDFAVAQILILFWYIFSIYKTIVCTLFDYQNAHFQNHLAQNDSKTQTQLSIHFHSSIFLLLMTKMGCFDNHQT